MSILSNTYESELDIEVLIESAKYMYRFHENCTLIFDNKWSAEACMTRHLSDQLATDINARIIKQMQQEIFNKMAVPASIFKA